MLDFLVNKLYEKYTLKSSKQLRNFKEGVTCLFALIKFSFFENKYFCSILLMAGFQTLRNKKTYEPTAT